MEFSFNTSALFKCDNNDIGIVDGSQYNKNSNLNISTVLDTIGELSAKVSIISKLI
jgi:hypothetical protein